MAAQLRNAYLNAMGIEVWQQRVPLPGAPGFAVPAREAAGASGAPESAGADPVADAGAAVTVGCATAAPDLCVLFELPGEVEPTREARGLLTDLVVALGGDRRKISFAAGEVLPTGGLPETGSPEDVDDSVAALLAGLVPAGVRRVVLLGKGLHGPALGSGAMADYRLCATRGLAELLAEPLLKRELWRDLQSVLTGDRERG